MSVNTIINTLTTRGIRLFAEGDRLVVEAPRGTLTDADRQVIREHKPELLRELLAANDGIDLESMFELACQGLSISPQQFRSLLTSEDIEAIAAGHYPVPTLAAYAKCMAEDLEAGRLRVLTPQRNDV